MLGNALFALTAVLAGAALVPGVGSALAHQALVSFASWARLDPGQYLPASP